MIKSPCIRECIFDEESDVCTGCLRTIKELRAWRTMTDAEKQDVLDRIQEEKCRSKIKLKQS
jgi:predicted Fe-S protein YdhL (DUF1289 family)